MGQNLERQYETAVSTVQTAHLERLFALGVLPATIARIGCAYPAFGIACGTFDKSGAFVPGDGAAHVIQPIIDNGHLIDLVAWRSDNPRRWGLRTGLGWLLNADTCLSSRWDGEHLDLQASPLHWLRADAVGGVVVDWDARDIEELRSFQSIRCGDAMLAAALKRALSKPRRLPRITAMEMRNAA